MCNSQALLPALAMVGIGVATGGLGDLFAAPAALDAGSLAAADASAGLIPMAAESAGTAGAEALASDAAIPLTDAELSAAPGEISAIPQSAQDLNAADAAAGMVPGGYGVPATGSSMTARGVMSDLSMGGALAGAIGSYKQGQFAKTIGAYDEAMTNLQVNNMNQLGVNAENTGIVQRNQLEGSQRAQMGASGAEVDSGTYGNVLTQTAQFGTLNALIQKYHYLNAAWGLQVQGQQEGVQAEMEQNTSVGQAAGTLLTGASTAYGIGTNYGRNAFAGW